MEIFQTNFRVYSFRELSLMKSDCSVCAVGPVFSWGVAGQGREGVWCWGHGREMRVEMGGGMGTQAQGEKKAIKR